MEKIIYGLLFLGGAVFVWAFVEALLIAPVIALSIMVLVVMLTVFSRHLALH